MTSLATTAASAHLTNQPGRALLAARGNHAAIDSTPPLGGPNEALNPLDLLLGALATCGVFLFETTARNEGITLEDVRCDVEADFDARGITDDAINPRVQRYRATVHATGPSATEKERLADAFRSNCPIFTTLANGADIELTVV